MTLEEKIHELCQKGELVHLSLAATGKEYRAIFAAASPAGGYATGVDTNPVRALMEALSAPIKKVRKTKERVAEEREDEKVDRDDPVGEDTPQGRTGRLSNYMD